MTISNLYQLDEYHDKIAGIIIPGFGEISHITQKIIASSGIPYMRAGRTSSTVFELIRDDVSKLTAEDTHKIRLITELAENALILILLIVCLINPCPTVYGQILWRKLC